LNPVFANANPSLPVPILSASPGHRRQVSRDLVAVVAITVGMFALSSALELRELITDLTRPLEHYQLDELPLTIAALALSLAWFAWRRWRQLQLTQKELEQTLTENRLLSQKYLLVQEEERRNLARELHDELGQCLNAIKLDAVSICELSKGAQAEIERSAGSIVEISNHVYEVVRSMMQRLRPAALDALGVRDAVADLVDQWRRRNPSAMCAFEADGDLAELGELTNITVYRLVQECLTNVAKHSGATHVYVGVARVSPVEVRATVRDNGRGRDANVKRAGLGLVGLRERVEALHGRLELAGAAGVGMHVTAWLPVASKG